MNCSSTSSTTTAESEWVPELLTGFRFHPDEEQMLNLLKKKMEGKLDSQASQIKPESGYQTWEPGNQSTSLFLRFLTEMMQGKFIPEIHVLEFEPWDLPGLLFPDSPYQPREWFAFIQLDHINTNSRSCRRKTEQGYWKITGQPREIQSQEHSFTCNKRTLTFYIRGKPKSEKTNWVMHEYFPTKTTLGSSGFVLVRVKNNSVNHRPSISGYMASNSGNQPPADAINHMIPAPEELLGHKEPEDVQFGSGDHDTSDHIITDAEEFLAYKDLENAVFGSDNHDSVLAGDGSPSEFHDQAVDHMIQEYLRDHPPAEPPQPPELGNVPVVSNDECSNRQSASNQMITDKEEFLAYEELENAVLGSDNPDAGLAGGGSPSDFDDQPVDDMIQEVQLCVELEDLDSSFLPELPQLGNVPDAYNHEFSNWESPIGENDFYLTNKNSISTNYSNIAYGAPDERISEAEENLGSVFDQLQREDYTLESTIFNSEQGDVLHANNYIGCNGSQFPDLEISTLFPQRS